MAVLAPADWQRYPPKDTPMDVPPNNSRQQRSSPSSDHSSNRPSHQPPHIPHQSQQHPPQMQPYTFPLQQQPQGGWTPSITAQPFYPGCYLPQQQSQSYPNQLPPQAPFYDHTNAQFWAYQQMLFSQVQQGFAHMPSTSLPSQQRTSPTPASDFYAQNQINFNSFPSGTPPPSHHRAGDHQSQSQQQNPQYTGFHPYRRPNRQGSHNSESSDWRPGPQPPYARPEASNSSTSLNSSTSHRQRTNSNNSGHNSPHNSPSLNSSSRPRNVSSASGSSSPKGSPTCSTTGSPAPPQLLAPHHRNSSSSSTGSAPSPRFPSHSSNSSTSSSISNSLSSVPRPARPSPLSQGNFTASEKRMSRDDSDLAAMREASQIAGMHHRNGGLKGRLRRALSFNAIQTLKEEEADDDTSIKASAIGRNKSTPKPIDTTVSTPDGIRSPESGPDDGASNVTVQTKKKSRAASLFNSRLNASTDNISLSSTVSSASVMIRKLGSIGQLARRNSLAGIASLFKDKDKDKDGGKKGKKKDKKGSAKAEASEASVSHVTAEVDRGSDSDWSVGGDLHGLSPAAKLARQHTLKSNAEAAAKAKALHEAQIASAAAAAAGVNETESNARSVNGHGSDTNIAGVPTWDRNTATRQGLVSPAKASGMRVNEDGTRVLVEDDGEESDGGYDGGSQGLESSFHADGWDDEEGWDIGDDQDGDEDMTIRVGIDRASLDDIDQEEHEPWAIDIRRSVERIKQPSRGILKNANNYDQQHYLTELPAPIRARSNSYDSHSTSELGPLARISSPDPAHIDGLHRHGSHSSSHGTSPSAPLIPPLPFESSSMSRLSVSLEPKDLKDLRDVSDTHTKAPHPPHPPEKTSPIFTHPNSSAPVLSTMNSTAPPPLTHRSATAPSKRLAFANNLSVYDTFSSSVYDRRSEPATWSRLTPALAQRIKEELNSYKMEEMEVHAASRIHTQFFV